MTVIRRINPISAFKMGFLVTGFLGLVLGVLCTAGTIAGVALVRNVHAIVFGGMGVYIGAFAVILCPLVYGMTGGLVAAVAALVCNLAAEWFGGLEVNIA